MAILPIRVAVADDHPAVIIGVASHVLSRENFLLAGSARNSSELIALLDSCDCDLLILDYVMPGGLYGDGLVLIDHVRRRYPGIRIVVFTMVETPRLLHEILGQGVVAIVSKKDATRHLMRALDQGRPDRLYLSPSIRLALQDAQVKVGSALGRRDAAMLHCAQLEHQPASLPHG